MSRYKRVYDCYLDGAWLARGTLPELARATGVPLQLLAKYRYEPRRGYEVRRAACGS